MKSIIVTIALLITANFSFAQIHVVKPNGDTGIGTKTPQAKLDVNGHTNIDGGLLTIGENNGGVSKIAVGHGRAKEGKSFIDLQTAAQGGYSGRFISGINGDGTAYTSLMHNGTGNFSIRMWNSLSDMVFRNTTGDRFTIKANGRIGVNTNDPRALLDVNGSMVVGNQAFKPGGGEFSTLSDKRTKKNINQYDAGLEQVLQLNPVTYNYNGKAGMTNTDRMHIGLIAQEYVEVAPYAVETYTHTETTENGAEKTEDFLSIDATAVKYMLVNAIKEQQALIETQQQLATKQQKEIEHLKEQISKITSNGGSVSPNENQISILLEGTGQESALLVQNTPNPFVTNTRIEYFIPANSRHCRLSFRDMNGKEIKQVDINHEGAGVVDLSAKDLATGIYAYVLYVNGDIVASKKMILKQQ